MSAPELSAVAVDRVPTAVYIVFMFAGMCAYIASASSCIVSIFLLHTSNTVPERKLHAFLLRSHSILWVPLGGLLAAIVFTSVSNNCATLIVYNTWWAAGVRIGIAVGWLVALYLTMVALSRAALDSAGPRAAELELQTARSEIA